MKMSRLSPRHHVHRFASLLLFLAPLVLLSQTSIGVDGRSHPPQSRATDAAADSVRRSLQRRSSTLKTRGLTGDGATLQDKAKKSKAPSQAPSVSAAPTTSPAPSVAPSESVAPSFRPSGAPTGVPSNPPTPMPSASPSDVPSTTVRTLLHHRCGLREAVPVPIGRLHVAKSLVHSPCDTSACSRPCRLLRRHRSNRRRCRTRRNL